MGDGDANSAVVALEPILTFRLTLSFSCRLTNIKGMRKIINALMNSVAELANVMLVFFLFMFVFAVIGLQVYGLGSNNKVPAFRQKCVYAAGNGNLTGTIYPVSFDIRSVARGGGE